MRTKESIIRYLGKVVRANRNQIAEALKAKPQVITVRLVELRRTGMVKYIKWADGSRVWILTKQGGERFDYYRRERGEN